MKDREYFSVKDLRRRGWTDHLIRRYAGPADHLAVNPHHPGGAEMRLYRADRIAEIEAKAEFIEARAVAERRQKSAQKALATKKTKAAASAAAIVPPPVLPPAPRAELIAMAVRWFNSTETWRGAGRWLSVGNPDAVLFPVVVDFIRDRLRDYRQKARPIGLPVDQAEAAVEQKLLYAIAAAYPWLKPDCQRQLDMRPGTGAAISPEFIDRVDDKSAGQGDRHNQ